MLATGVGSLSPVVPAPRGGAWDPEWLPQLPRSGGFRQASPGASEPGAWPGFQALAL